MSNSTLLRLAGALLASAVALPAAAATQNYTFTTATNGSLADMSSGTTVLVPANTDDAASPLGAIGFEFYFQGVAYTQFSASSNGLIRLGAVAHTTTPYNPLGLANQALISAFGSDQRTHTSGRVHARVIGSAPNRTLVIEWLNMQANFNTGGTADLTYQVHLQETTNAIDFVYGSIAMSALGAGSTDSQDPHIGFSSSNVVGTIGTVTAPQSGTPAPTYNGAAAAPVGNLYTAGPVPALTSAADGSRRVFSFDPPPPPPAPTALGFTGTNQISTTLNWTDNSVETAFYVYRSTDGGANYTLAGITAANATSFNDTTLSPSTTYFYRVRGESESGFGPYSTPASVTTPAAGTVVSTAAGGLWSLPGTWVGGNVPAATDLVEIEDGATVTVDTAAVAFTLDVGSGSGGATSLLFEDATARTLTVGSLTRIAPNGTLASAGTGTVTTHVFSTSSLDNDGTLDLSTNADTAGAVLSFGGSNDGVFEGSGPVSDVRGITMAKASRDARIDLTVPSFTVMGATTDNAGFLTINGGTLRIGGTFAMTNRVFASANYAIPALGGFWLDNPNFTVAPQASAATVSGLFRVSNGTFNVGTAINNQLAFNTGAVIVVEGGAINSSGRFGTAAIGTVHSYTQSGGIVTVATIGNNGALASFDLGQATASTIAMTGGTVAVQIASTNGTPRDYRVQGGAGLASVTGGEVRFGTAGSGAAKTFTAVGVLPNVVVTNTSAGHTLTFAAPAVVNNATDDVLVQAGATFNIGNLVFLFNGDTFTNNGTLTANGASSNFVTFRTNAPVLYTGTGNVTVPMTTLALQSDQGFTIDPASPTITVGALRIFSGNLANGDRLTIGTGAASTSIVQVGNTTTPTAAGVVTGSPTFNPGTGGISLIYLRTTASRTLGAEVPASRAVNAFTYDDNDPTHTLTIAGGDFTVNTTASFTNGRIVTGANTFIANAPTINRTAGYVDGNLRMRHAAAGARVFHLGTANGYSPVSFNPTAATFPADVTIGVEQAAAPNVPNDQGIDRHWDINAPAGTTADLVFNYLEADIPANVTEANLQLLRGNGASYDVVPATINTTANTATVTGVTQFSPWTLGVPSGELVIAPNPLDFGDVAVGSSAALTTTLGNTGIASLDITSIDSPAGAFSRTGGTCAATPITLAAGASCTIEYTFTPTAGGAANGALAVDSTANDLVINLTGNGLQGELEIDPATVPFGNVTVGVTSAPQVATLENTGNASLNVTTLDAPSGVFARSGGNCGAAPFALAAGATCTIEYTFTPAATGPAQQVLNVAANAPGGGTITLSGNGVQGTLAVSGSPIDFGDVTVNTSSPVQFITLSNTGSASLDVTALTLAAAPFVRTNDGTCGNTLPITIAAGASCTLSYRFDPTAIGPAQQTFTVTANAPGTGATFSLTGSGRSAADLIFRDGFE